MATTFGALRHRFLAPSLAEALDRGLLPDYETSIALEATL